MEYPIKSNISYQEIQNGALIMLLLQESRTWEELCAKYKDVNPIKLRTNTNTMMLASKLFEMREIGLLSFEDEETKEGRRPIGDITQTDLWPKIRVAFGGMSLSDSALLSQHSKGMAVVPVFGRAQKTEEEEKVDVFVLMPFKAELEKVYKNHIKKAVEELGIKIGRADEIFSPRPFMEKVWEGICASKLVLADCTQKNPNVFYEIGIAHTVGKKVVLLTRSEDDVPSDIKHFDYISYIYDPEGIEALTQKLKTFLISHFKVGLAAKAADESRAKDLLQKKRSSARPRSKNRVPL